MPLEKARWLGAFSRLMSNASGWRYTSGSRFAARRRRVPGGGRPCCSSGDGAIGPATVGTTGHYSYFRQGPRGGTVPLRNEAADIAGEIAELRHAIHQEPEIGLDLPKTQQK